LLLFLVEGVSCAAAGALTGLAPAFFFLSTLFAYKYCHFHLLLTFWDFAFTIRAQTVKLGVVAQDNVFGQLLLECFFGASGVVQGHIIDSVTLEAEKVIMGPWITIVPALAASVAQFLDKLLLLEDAQVAVHCAQAYIGHFGPHLVV